MGALNGESIRPGESIPFRILPPGGGAIGPLSDPVYISVPFDTLGGTPGRCRWAIVDATGKVIDSNDADAANGWRIPMCGFRMVARAGAYQLTIENKEPAGGRVIGPPTFEWKYADVAAEAVPVSGNEPATA